MSCYFDDCQSLRYAQGTDTDAALAAIMNRYLADNPACPPVFRVSRTDGIPRNAEYRYVFDLDRIFPDTERERFVYARAKLWSGTDRAQNFRAVPYGPMRVLVNGETAFQSNYYEEKTRTAQRPVKAKLRAGWNEFLLVFLKTPLGFGGEFGSAFFKYTPVRFLAPTAERDGQEGFLYTHPMEELSDLSILTEREEAHDPIEWLPRAGWNREEQALGRFGRLFGIRPGSVACARAGILLAGDGVYRIEGDADGPVSVFVREEKVLETGAGGPFRAEFTAESGPCGITVESVCGKSAPWDFRLTVNAGGTPQELFSPCGAKGARAPWIFAGPFREHPDPAALADMSRLLKTENGDDYWRADLPGAYVRPFLETDNFGQWNYPVGVTLYGLMEAADAAGRRDVSNYAYWHIRLCTDFMDYAVWDQQKFGAASLNFQAASMESLDDCGSFASTMLEQSFRRELPGSREIAGRVADFIEHRMTRLPDGTLYRFRSSLSEMKNTVWLDDLYMSVPFLTRYFRLTGDRACLDDAARQFLLYRDKMFLPELNVLSHVYYTDRKLQSGVPWGRGNGWVLFSLSELLAVLPSDHAARGELLALFRTLCSGYRALQDENGLWHQVLNDPESYPESSCSAMFAAAFARGVRNGWFAAQETDAYRSAALKGWRGLTENAVDAGGNIYGICRGSGHSFTPRYYKYELNWIKNDTHGIGIVLIAGAEVKRMLASGKKGAL